MTFLRSHRVSPTARTSFGGDAGATAVEYALLVAGVALVMIVGVAFLGSRIGGGVASAAEAMSGTSAGVDAGAPATDDEAAAADQAAADQAAADQAAADQAAADQAAADQAAADEAARIAAEEQSRIATEKAAEDARIAAEQQAAADQTAAEQAAAEQAAAEQAAADKAAAKAAAERAKDIKECEAKKGYSWNYAKDRCDKDKKKDD